MNREFDEEKIHQSSKNFDKNHANDYESFLLSIPEIQVINIPICHAYKRVKLMNMRDQAAYLQKIGYVPLSHRVNPEPRKESTTGYKAYKSWGGD